MRMVFILSLVLIAGLFLPHAAAAVAAPSASIFGNYVGSTQWSVDVTEDLGACGGSSFTYSRTIYIDHYIDSAIVGDWGHGSARGTFSGNRLRMPARSIPDGAGDSNLAAFDIVFEADCSGFSGRYSWNYYDLEFACSGSTSLRATRLGGTECPGSETPERAEEQARVINSARADLKNLEELRREAKYLQDDITEASAGGVSSEELAQLRADLRAKQEQLDLLQSKVESSYDDILKKDPNNFWANWDMAELRKDEGNYGAYFDYFDTAASSEHMYLITRADLERKAAVDLGLSQFPTVDRSIMMRRITSDTTGWEGGWIYDVNVLKGAADDHQTWTMKLYTTYSKKAYDYVNDIVGLPGENE